MNHETLIQTLQQYISDLMQIKGNLIQSPYTSLSYVKLIQNKIQLKLQMFRKSINGLQAKPPKGKLTTLKHYYRDTFNQIVKQAYRILHLKDHMRSMSIHQGGNKQNKFKAKLSFLRQIQQQMSQEWTKQNIPSHQNSITRNIQNLSMLNSQVEQTQIKKLAKDYLHKQFLAIRMIAYKMYEQYMTHGHQNTKKQIAQLKTEQQYIKNQINQLRELNKQLHGQQKRLVRDLHEIKRTNDLIGKRYFTYAVEHK